MINRSIKEWDYLPIGSTSDDGRSITREQANQLLAVARPASLRLKMGGIEGERILADGRHRLRAGQVVGIVSTPTITLEILPKIADIGTRQTRQALIHMLARVFNLPIATGTVTQLGWQRDDLLEIIIRLFCGLLFDEIHKGLPHRYMPNEFDLAALRGRLDVIRQFTMLAVSPQKLACRYDELSSDTPLNQIMKAAVVRLRKIARANENQRRLTELELVFAEISDVPVDRLPWNQVLIDRTNKAWAELFGFAKLLLGDRFQTTSAGPESGFSMLFEMNTLFEEFIGRTLKIALRREGRRVSLQGPRAYAATGAGDRRLFATRPDIAIHGSDSIDWIIDTKWKQIEGVNDDPKHGVAQSDLYQMMAYGQVYRCRNLLLLYPHHDGVAPEAGFVADFGINGAPETRLIIATVDMTAVSSVAHQLRKLVGDPNSDEVAAEQRRAV